MVEMALGYPAFAEEHRDERKKEILDGVAYMAPQPGLAHIRSSFTVAKIFDRFFDGKECEVFEEAQVYFSEKDKPIPDVSVVCNPEILKPTGIFGAPNLVVEILSRSTSKRDRGYKFNLYEKYGVKEYWIIDIKNRILAVFLLNDEGKYKLCNEYYVFDEHELENMDDNERAEVQYEFTTHLSDELIIDVREVFKNAM